MSNVTREIRVFRTPEEARRLAAEGYVLVGGPKVPWVRDHWPAGPKLKSSCPAGLSWYLACLGQTDNEDLLLSPRMVKQLGYTNRTKFAVPPGSPTLSGTLGILIAGRDCPKGDLSPLVNLLRTLTAPKICTNALRADARYQAKQVRQVLMWRNRHRDAAARLGGTEWGPAHWEKAVQDWRELLDDSIPHDPESKRAVLDEQARAALAAQASVKMVDPKVALVSAHPACEITQLAHAAPVVVREAHDRSQPVLVLFQQPVRTTSYSLRPIGVARRLRTVGLQVDKYRRCLVLPDERDGQKIADTLVGVIRKPWSGRGSPTLWWE